MSQPVTINSIEEFLNVLEGNQDFGSRTVYRGQIEAWDLQPKLYRIDFKYIPKGAVDLRNLETELLSDFEKQARPYLQSIPQSKLEWIALAQHHGLPTRLLDWTQSPLVALFFAVDDPAPSTDGVVWSLRTQNIPERAYIDLDGIDDIRPDGLLYFPAHINPRISAQQGCFTVHQQPFDLFGSIPLNQESLEGDFSREIRQFTIPADKKK